MADCPRTKRVCPSSAYSRASLPKRCRGVRPSRTGALDRAVGSCHPAGSEAEMRGGIQVNKLAAFVCSVAVCGFGIGHAQQSAERTTLGGIFTAEQAKRGEQLFQARCAPCHGADLHALDPDAPDLTDDGFKSGWVGKT